jgi:hypothetical protein
MTKHFHECLCGKRWTCILNIIPLPGGLGGIRCERWPSMGICSDCLDSALAGRDQQEVTAILESMMACGDPLLSIQATQKLIGIPVHFL